MRCLKGVLEKAKGVFIIISFERKWGFREVLLIEKFKSGEIKSVVEKEEIRHSKSEIQGGHNNNLIERFNRTSD